MPRLHPALLTCVAMLTCCLASLQAQPAGGQPPSTLIPLTEQPPVALPWVIAAAITIVILLVVCMPSRKS